MKQCIILNGIQQAVLEAAASIDEACPPEGENVSSKHQLGGILRFRVYDAGLGPSHEGYRQTERLELYCYYWGGGLTHCMSHSTLQGKVGDFLSCRVSGWFGCCLGSADFEASPVSCGFCRSGAGIEQLRTVIW